jgi:hypothetical protein
MTTQESPLNFISESVVLEQTGFPHSAVQKLYVGLDKLLKESNWAALDLIFNEFPPEITPLNITIGVLIWTWRDKEKLPGRERYFQEVESVLRTFVGVDPEAVLIGLK